MARARRKLIVVPGRIVNVVARRDASRSRAFGRLQLAPVHPAYGPMPGGSARPDRHRSRPTADGFAFAAAGGTPWPQRMTGATGSTTTSTIQRHRRRRCGDHAIPVQPAGRGALRPAHRQADEVWPRPGDELHRVLGHGHDGGHPAAERDAARLMVILADQIAVTRLIAAPDWIRRREADGREAIRLFRPARPGARRAADLRRRRDARGAAPAGGDRGADRAEGEGEMRLTRIPAAICARSPPCWAMRSRRWGSFRARAWPLSRRPAIHVANRWPPRSRTGSPGMRRSW